MRSAWRFSKDWKGGRAVFQALEKTEVRGQKSAVRFSGAWKNTRGFFRALEKRKSSTQRRREKAKGAKPLRCLCALGFPFAPLRYSEPRKSNREGARTGRRLAQNHSHKIIIRGAAHSLHDDFVRMILRPLFPAFDVRCWMFGVRCSFPAFLLSSFQKSSGPWKADRCPLTSGDSSDSRVKPSDSRVKP
jgi:hypothetical protein